jgi:hypothetical protein
MLDASGHGSDLYRFPHNKLIFDDDEKAVDEIANQMLRAEAERQACQSRYSRDRRDIKTEHRQCGKDCANGDDGGSRAIQQAGKGFYVLLAHPRDSTQALGSGRRN